MRVGSQQPGNSSPASLLTSASTGVRSASLIKSSLHLLALSNTEISSHNIGWWSVQACSAIADLSNSPLLHAFWCSLTLVSNLLVVSPMYTLPHVQGILYTTDDLIIVGNLSLTLDNCERSVCPDLNATLISNLLHIRLMSSLIAAMYGIVIIRDFLSSCVVSTSLVPLLFVSSFLAGCLSEAEWIKALGYPFLVNTWLRCSFSFCRSSSYVVTFLALSKRLLTTPLKTLVGW